MECGGLPSWSSLPHTQQTWLPFLQLLGWIQVRELLYRAIEYLKYPSNCSFSVMTYQLWRKAEIFTTCTSNHFLILLFFAGINSLKDLANQREVSYGTVGNSAVQKFFETQVAEPYTKMAAFMQQEGTYVENASFATKLVQDSYGSHGLWSFHIKSICLYICLSVCHSKQHGMLRQICEL